MACLEHDKMNHSAICAFYRKDAATIFGKMFEGIKGTADPLIPLKTNTATYGYTCASLRRTLSVTEVIQSYKNE